MASAARLRIRDDESDEWHRRSEPGDL